jgi:hypothetical protein
VLDGADHRPGDQIAVTVEVLGGAVHHQVDTDLARPEVDRRGKGAVDHRHQVVRLGKGRCRLQITNLHQRVGDRLEEHQPGLGTQRSLPVRRALRVGQVDSAVRDAQPRGILVEKRLGTTVERPLRQQMPTAADEG